MSEASSIRVRRGRQNANYTAISNRLIDHPELSCEARLVLIYLLSKPTDWQLQISDLRRLLGKGDKACGRNKTYQVLAELKSSNYVVAIEEKDNGRFVGITYYVYDEPFENEEITAESSAKSRASAPFPENRDTVEIEQKSPCTENRDTGQNPYPQFRDTENRHIKKNRKKQNTDLPPYPPGRGHEEGKVGFDDLWNDWPENERPDKRRAAKWAFDHLEPGKQKLAVELAEKYRTLAKARGERALMIPYLKGGQFDELVDAPQFDDKGRFRITAERPEWQSWLAHLSKTYGKDACERIAKLGYYLAEHRWPPLSSQGICMHNGQAAS